MTKLAKYSRTLALLLSLIYGCSLTGMGSVFVLIGENIESQFFSHVRVLAVSVIEQVENCQTADVIIRKILKSRLVAPLLNLKKSLPAVQKMRVFLRKSLVVAAHQMISQRKL